MSSHASQSDRVSYPASFPTDCPPSASTPPNCRVYRLVGSDPPRGDDFVSQAVRYPGSPHGDPCEACGLSVFLEEAHAVRLRETSPALRKWRHLVAAGDIEPHHGAILDTSASGGSVGHHTWWVAEGVRPHELFVVVGTVGGQCGRAT